MGNVVPRLLVLVIDLAVRLAIAGSAGYLGNWLLNKGSTKKPDHFDSRVSRGAAAVVGGVLILLAGLWAGAGILDEVRAFRAGEGQYFEAARPSLEDEFPIVVDQIDAYELCRGDLAILAARVGRSDSASERLDTLCVGNEGEAAFLLRYESGWRFTDQSCYLFACTDEAESAVTEWLRPDGLREKCTRPKDGDKRCLLLPAR